MSDHVFLLNCIVKRIKLIIFCEECLEILLIRFHLEIVSPFTFISEVFFTAFSISPSASCTQNAVPCFCNYQGRRYNIRDEFELVDRCTRCSCQANGEVTCSGLACIKKVCSYNGMKYDIGQTWKNECNTCSCQGQGQNDPQARCTRKTCGCKEPSTGRIYKATESWQPDKCTTCTCTRTATSYAPSCKKNPGCKV